MRGTVVAEQFGEHLADNAGDNIAIALHTPNIRQAGKSALGLKFGHAGGHDADAAGERPASGLGQCAVDAHDKRRLGNELAIPLSAPGRQDRAKFAREDPRILTIRHHRRQPLGNSFFCENASSGSSSIVSAIRHKR